MNKLLEEDILRYKKNRMEDQLKIQKLQQKLEEIEKNSLKQKKIENLNSYQYNENSIYFNEKNTAEKFRSEKEKLKFVERNTNSSKLLFNSKSFHNNNSSLMLNSKENLDEINQYYSIDNDYQKKIKQNIKNIMSAIVLILHINFFFFR